MEKLDEVLGITEKAVAVTSSTPLVPRTQTEDEDNDDFKYSRENHQEERQQKRRQNDKSAANAG